MPVLGPAVEHPGIGVCDETTDLSFELVLAPYIVGIEKGDELTRRVSYAEIA